MLALGTNRAPTHRGAQRGGAPVREPSNECAFLWILVEFQSAMARVNGQSESQTTPVVEGLNIVLRTETITSLRTKVPSRR